MALDTWYFTILVGIVIKEVEVCTVLMQQVIGAGNTNKGSGKLTKLAVLIRIL